MGGQIDDIGTENTGIRVLVVEANAKEAAAVRNLLKASPPNFVISPARQLWSATQILAGMPIDAVLLGLGLPECEGISALIELRQQAPDTPMLIVGNDPALGQQAVEAGADDYLYARELEPKHLGMSVIDAIERRRRSMEVEASSEASLETALETGSATILVVEEDPWVQRLLKRNLARRGHRVEVVSSPQDALAWSQSCEDGLDLLICDVHASGMEGARLSGHLSERFPEMITLLVSADSRQPDVVSEHPGGFAFLCKPYTLDDFQGTVDRLTEDVVCR
jgi:DNA-binding NtrC family response regulator